MGPVGVGKSTHMRLLGNYFESQNARVVWSFIKSGHMLSYILRKALIAFGACEKVMYPDGLARVYPRRDIVRRLFRLWCFLDAFSIVVKFFFSIYIPYKLGFTLLIEEGLSMTLFTYCKSFPHFFDTEPKDLKLFSSLLGWIQSKSHHVNIVLDANADELSRRRRYRSFRQDELLDYISMQKKWIEAMDLGDTIFIETTGKPILVVHDNIVAALNGRMGLTN